MVTIKEIAERAGVSTTTVSNVIHGKTKKVSPDKIEQIQKLVDEMGYVKPMGLNVLHKKRSHLVAVIINRHQVYEQSVLNDPFYANIVGYIEEELHKNGYYMLLYSADKADDIFNMVMTWNVDSVILVSMSVQNCARIKKMIDKPVIVIDPVKESGENYGVGCIRLNDEKGGYIMTKHLLELEYKTIYICGGNVNWGVDEKRVMGALRAVKEGGFEKKVSVIPVSAGISYKERVKFYEHIHKKFPYQNKTAVFCTADRYALEASSYLQERGIQIPKDLGLAGFDGISFMGRNSFPRLTTVRQNVFEKASLAVQEIIRAVENPDYVMVDHLVDVTLIVRQSTN